MAKRKNENAPEPSPAERLADVRHRADMAEQKNRLALEQNKAATLRQLRSAARPLPRGRGTGGDSSVGGGAWALSGSYRSSRTSRTRTQLGGGPGGSRGRALPASADAHLDEVTLRAVRSDAQDLHRNSELARSLITRLADLTVGDGSTVTPRTKSEEFNAAVARLWRSYWEFVGIDPSTGVHGVDARGLAGGAEWERLVTQQVATDGDELLPLLANGTVQVIDADRITSDIGPRGGGVEKDWTSGGGGETCGVLLDRVGKPVGFRVADYAPGGAGVERSTRVVSAANALFLINPRGKAMGINQTRGEPLLAPVFDRIVQLDGYIEATQIAARVAACLTAYVKSKNPAGMQAALAGQPVTAANGDGTTRTDQEMTFQPGSVWHLLPEEDVGSITPNQPTASFEGYVRSSMELICAHVGVPLLMAFFDPSGINLSTMRGMVITAGVGFRAWQEWRVRSLLAPLYRWRVAMWIREGKLPAPPADWAEHEWITEPVPVLDPDGEARFWSLCIEKGLATRDMATRSMWGKPGKVVVDERVKEQKDEEAQGLVLLTTPGQQVKDAADKGQGPSKPDDPADPDKR